MATRLGRLARLGTVGGVLLLAVAAPAPAQRSDDDAKIPTDGNLWETRVRSGPKSLGALRSRALRRAIDDYRSTGTTGLRRDVAVTWGEFLSGTAEPFLAIALDRPAADGELEPGSDVSIFGQLLDASGKVVGDFETEDRVEAAAGRVIVDASTPLPVNAARGFFGIAVRGKPRWLVEQELAPSPIDRDAFGLSRILLSLDVHPLPEPQRPDDPFCFGGLRVTPHGERAFRPTDEPWLFVVVRAPGTAEGTTPSISAELSVQGAGMATPRKYPILGASATPMLGFRDQFGLGVPLPVSALPPGDYEASLVVSRRGTLEPASATATTTFRVDAAPAGS